VSYVPKPRNKMDNTPRTPSDDPLEPLLIRLTEDVSVLPKGFIYSLPRFDAEILIMRRKAVAVGKLGMMADITLTEDELAEAGF
jgi:hypothetical protein